MEAIDKMEKFKVLTLFGTRPETIKLAPVILELERHPKVFQTINVTSGQHTDLLVPFVKQFNLRIDHNLEVAEPRQTLSGICSKVLSRLDALLVEYAPDLLLVQGDTTTALAGAMAAFHRKIAVGHVEAGLRSGNHMNPYPEEMNRRLITQIAELHFAATNDNASNLLNEGINNAKVYQTGNTVVDALHMVLDTSGAQSPVDADASADKNKLIVLTTHRRESFGEVMSGNLAVLKQFVDVHPDVTLAFPAHPNPAVREVTNQIFKDHERIQIVEPMAYPEFIRLLSSAWLIVSDSGGVQEEAPSLGVPLFVIRENTERPEAIKSGVAKLIKGGPAELKQKLDEVYADDTWLTQVKKQPNPFGNGDSGTQIRQAIERHFQLIS